MTQISTGEPNTLATWRKIAKAMTGEGSKAVAFFDKKIADSPNGENEEVIADESQVLMLIASMIRQVGGTTE